jgi:tetratricopeptide (TPR) repeat protein
VNFRTSYLKQALVVSFLFFVLLCTKAALEHLLDKRPRPRFSVSVTESTRLGHTLARYGFGFETAISDSLWIDLLQHARHQQLPPGEVSWEAAQLDAVTRLDSRFERAYQYGGVVLSVLIQDREGARRILEKWIQHSPNNWRARYLLGYHLFYELGEYERASTQILRASEMEGSPQWLASLGVRLLSETGALTESLRLCIELYDQVRYVEGRDRLALRIRSLNYALQRHGWKSALERFTIVKGRKPIQTQELLPYISAQMRKISSSITGAGTPIQLAVLLRERFVFHYDPKLDEMVSNSKTLSFLEDVGIRRPLGRIAENQ